MFFNLFKIEKENSGYTLIEVLFYVIIFAILAIALLDAMINMISLFSRTMINSDIIQGSSIVENISRELKQANDFSFNSNTLVLNTKDINDNTKTITYTFSGSNIQMADSIVGDLGNLNTPNISIESFNVSAISTSYSKAAKVILAIKSNRDTGNGIESFQNTILLRGSY